MDGTDYPQGGSTEFCSFGEVIEPGLISISKEPKKPDFIDGSNIRDSPSYLLAMQAIRGTTVVDRCDGLEFKLEGRGSVRRAVAMLEGAIDRMGKHANIPQSLKYARGMLLNTTEAYMLALEDSE